MNDMAQKADGFGIGELGNVPESDPMAELTAAEIIANAQANWVETMYERYGFCEECHERISRRVYFSDTMGCAVTCEKHWIAYHVRILGCEPTFEAVMAALKARANAESKRVKHCAVCGSASAQWNSGAGQDLCDRHWDSY